MFKNTPYKISILLSLLTFILTGCTTPAYKHHASLHSSKERELTVGVVQARLYKGMAAAEVAEVLGSPNIVTQDSSGDETWVYDKIASEASYSNDSSSTTGLLGAGGDTGNTLILGGLLSSYNKNAGAYGKTQRTLTVVIKYNQQKKVKDFSYHSSKF
jgi:outer membrane protein assembly factor BamE (lipoprotein component of BamABCDE complex)